MTAPHLPLRSLKAVSDSLVPRTMMAAKELGYKRLSSAAALRQLENKSDFTAAAEKAGCSSYVPPLRLCGDNGAMIGAQGYYEYLAGHTAGSDLNAYATMDI